MRKTVDGIRRLSEGRQVKLNCDRVDTNKRGQPMGGKRIVEPGLLQNDLSSRKCQWMTNYCP
jgi:hypothetical protein